MLSPSAVSISRSALYILLLLTALGCKSQNELLDEDAFTLPLVVEAELEGERPHDAEGVTVKAKLVNRGERPIMVRHGHPLFGLEIYRWQSDEWVRDSRTDAMPRVPVTSASIAGPLGPGESKTACFRDEVSCLDGWQLVDIPFPLESGTYKLLLYVMLDNDPGGVIRLYSEPMITIVK